MSPDPLSWPDFDAAFLRGIGMAFLRRRRALCQSGQLTCEREFTETSTAATERLNLDWSGDLQLRLSVWADGVMWLRACAPRPGRNAGWAFLHHFHGDLSSVSPKELVKLFEKSLLLCSFPDMDCGNHLRTLWDAVKPQGGA